ncbi:MAG: phytanoyl-CoA dioxygenase [Deltaproteobacteria bacterium]|jgi:ectoine hydroxylase-related dioxygenase (phytanoyl-CoA dioxygenase family)|nr:phytanoyl-CoA dioxygenase [Deltaproteobacteria bacterium]
MNASQLDRHLAAIDDQGFTIVENAIEPALLDEIRSEVRRTEEERGSAPRGNPAEGYATLRNYNLLAKGAAFQKLPVHESVLPIAERMLDEGCLLSGMTSMHIGPGEKLQPLHADDGMMGLPRPHVPLMCVTMWAFTDFTEDNGATRYVPGSHKFDHAPDYSKEYETLPAEMPAGSILIFDGSLWHGGGANCTESDWRLGVHVQFCAGWARTQQNAYLGIPPEVARTFPDRLLELCGYSLYKGIMGHIDGTSPGAILGEERMAETAYASRRMESMADEAGAQTLREKFGVGDEPGP